MQILKIIILLFCLTNFLSCRIPGQQEHSIVSETNKILTGADQTEIYLTLLQDQKVAIVANQTSVINGAHLVDSLLGLGVNVIKVFGPEHGFRGNAADGELVSNEIDQKTSLPVISLYGSNKKPKPEQLNDIDIVIFDIQDVGARFYTYISTMAYMMEACAENNIQMIVLDRPNPHGDYVDGPVLDSAFSSFVGLHQIPVVHGMTIGEYALMVNGEGWLKNGVQCELTVVPCLNYSHKDKYDLPVAPSPNLPNMTAIYLYPSLCFFEGTIISVGRGTEYPFQVIGHPDFSIGSFVFTPTPIPGVTVHPKHEGKACYGQSLQGFAEHIVAHDRRLHLNWLINYFNYFKDKDVFFTSYFDKLAGSDQLRKQIESGKTEEDIRQSWKEGLEAFKEVRKKYLLYTDFELTGR